MNPQNRLGPRAGATLLELLTGLATVSALTLIALPKLGRSFDHAAVKAARGEVSSKFQLARMVATQGGRTTVLRVAGNRVWVEARPRAVAALGSTADTVGAVSDLRAVHAVVVSRAPDSVVYSPHGLAATGGSFVLRRAGVIDSVLVSALGQVLR